METLGDTPKLKRAQKVYVFIVNLFKFTTIYIV